MADALVDPLHVLLNRGHHVAQHRGAAGAGHGEEVREAVDRQSEVGVRPLGPEVAQALAVTTADIDGQQGASHAIKACREDQAVEGVLGAAGDQPGLCDLLDRRILDIDERHVRTVIGRVVVRVDAEALRAERVVVGAEQFGDGWVGDGRADLVADKLGGCLVGCLVRGDVVERREEREAAFVPATLVLGLAFFGRDSEGRRCALGPDVACGSAARGGAGLTINRLAGRLRGGIHRTIPSGNTEVRSALKHGHVFGLCGDLRDRLDTGRAGADNANTLAREVHAGLGPAGRVVPRALEAIEAREAWCVRYRQAACGHHKPARCQLTMIGCDVPEARILVPPCGSDARLELDVAA